MTAKNQLCTLDLSAGGVPCIEPPVCPTRKRLARAFARLQRIRMVRNHRQDPLFEKSAEERIIWRELLELELQLVDDQIGRSVNVLKEERDGGSTVSGSGRCGPGVSS